MAKKTTAKSWKDLTSLKKRIDITFEGQKLFYMEEPNDEVLQTLLEMQSQNENNDDSSFATMAYALKNICKDINFDGMTDEEITMSMDEMSDEIIIQINNALELFVTNKLFYRLDNLKKMVKQLEDNGVELVN